MTTQGSSAGSVGEVKNLGADWGFDLLDAEGRELVLFTFHIEGDARRAAKAMHAIIGEAATVTAPDGPSAVVPARAAAP